MSNFAMICSDLVFMLFIAKFDIGRCFPWQRQAGYGAGSLDNFSDLPGADGVSQGVKEDLSQ